LGIFFKSVVSFEKDNHKLMVSNQENMNWRVTDPLSPQYP